VRPSFVLGLQLEKEGPMTRVCAGRKKKPMEPGV